MKKWQAFLAITALSFLPGVAGFAFANQGAGWYQSISKPAFTPPSPVFAPVWGLVYFLAGIAVFIVWKDWVDKRERRNAYIIFGVSLLLDGIWPFLFFSRHWLPASFIGGLVLWAVITAMIVLFRKVSKKTTRFLAPYWLWVCFLAVLNGFVWKLNP